MKKGKFIKKITLLICMLATVSAETLLASAAKSTSYTFTQSTTTDELEIVEDAFLPDGAYLELGIDSAQDMDVKNGLVYIADTGNGRVLVLDHFQSQKVLLLIMKDASMWLIIRMVKYIVLVKKVFWSRHFKSQRVLYMEKIRRFLLER